MYCVVREVEAGGVEDDDEVGGGPVKVGELFIGRCHRSERALM